MARRGFFGRIADAVRSVIPGRKEIPKPAPPPEPPSAKDIIDIVSPPPPKRPPGRGAPPILPGRPRYRASTDDFTGSQFTDSEWEEIKEKAERNLSEGYANFTYHTSLVSNRARGRHLTPRTQRSIDEISADLLGFTHPKDRYADIIKAIETGQVTPEQVSNLLDAQYRAYDSYATSLDTGPGSARWTSRNMDLPDSLYFYH